MHLTVVIPSYRRAALVARLLAHLGRQSRLPDAVIVCAPDASHLDPLPATAFALSYSHGEPGLCAQRNRALELCAGATDIIVFLDDDFVPADDYLELVENAFATRSDYAVLMGYVLADGAHGAGLDFDEGLAIIAAYAGKRLEYPAERDHPGAYGCNMSIRACHIGAHRFDERLPLYGWQEDIDFTARLRGSGRIVALSALRGVHLGVKSGRVSGVRLGYSQVINPIYLIRKGTMQKRFGLRLMARNIAANLAKSIVSEPYIDRRGRLKGNLLAVRHLLRGRIDPEYILKL